MLVGTAIEVSLKGRLVVDPPAEDGVGTTETTTLVDEEEDDPGIGAVGTGEADGSEVDGSAGFATGGGGGGGLVVWPGWVLIVSAGGTREGRVGSGTVDTGGSVCRLVVELVDVV